MPKQRLAIHPAPFKSSHLAIPPSPFSPLSPLTPASRPEPRTTSTSIATTDLSIRSVPDTRYVPDTPLQWVWTCHACHSAYPLGATRRCLDDGHHFCAGTTIVKKWRHDSTKRRVKRHKACASEFDYRGWKGWGRWKRAALPSKPTSIRATTTIGGNNTEGSSTLKNCWAHCDYPSQCRWGKTVGIHTPTTTRTTFSFNDSSISTSVLNNPIDFPSLDDCFATSPPPDTGPEGTVCALSRALEAGAKRRKSLGSVLPTLPLKMEFSQTSAVFDVEMVDAEDPLDPPPFTSPSTMFDESYIDPALLALSNTDTSYSPQNASVSAAGGTGGEKSRTVEKLKSVLGLSGPRPSRRYIELLPVSNAQRRLRRRHAMSGLSL